MPAATVAAHNIFSVSHGDTTGAAAPVDGDVIIGNATPKWSKLAITVPAATYINVLGVANAELRPSWKGLFDANVPVTQNYSDAAATGSATVAARRDHVHGMPAATVAAHNIFSVSHGDTTGAAAPVDGDVIIGNATPKWSKLAITVPAATFINYLAVANAELRPSWKALFDATVPTTIGVSDIAATGSAVVAARRDHQHGSPATFPATAHNLFSTTHGDTTGAAAPVDGDIIIGNVTPKWSKLAITVPGGASLLNVLGVINGETRPSWKALFDATNPTTIAPSAAASPGTLTVAAHRDHTHGAPATWAPDAHAVLSASHSDTLAAGVADGSIIIGNVTPKWSALAISVPAATFINHLAIANAETRPSWKALFDATVPTTIGVSDVAATGSAVVAARRDHQHGSPATFPATAHNIFSTTHGDTTGAASPVDGDIIIGNVTPKWSKLAISIPGGASLLNVLGVINGELRPSWKALFDATVPAAIGTATAGTLTVAAHRDHAHNFATQAANTVLANATAGVAVPTPIALGTTNLLGRDAANIIAVTVTSPLAFSGAGALTHLATDGNIHVPAAGASTQLLQWSAAGSAKWVTMSGDATIADGGAVTVSTTLTSGWVSFTAASWVRADDGSFTISGNYASTFPSGTKIKYTQSAVVKYAIVVDAVYSAPNTTVRIFVATDIITNVAITATYFSYGFPSDFPAYMSYTPTWTCSGAMTYGTGGTAYGKFRMVGLHTMLIELYNNATTGGVADTTIYGSLPIPFSGANIVWVTNAPGSGFIRDATYQTAVVRTSAATPTLSFEHAVVATVWGLGTNRLVAGNILLGV
jgi:hypothetical protein